MENKGLEGSKAAGARTGAEGTEPVESWTGIAVGPPPPPKSWHECGPFVGMANGCARCGMSPAEAEVKPGRCQSYKDAIIPIAQCSLIEGHGGHHEDRRPGGVVRWREVTA